MATDTKSLVFTTASAAVDTKQLGLALLGIAFPASVDNSAAKVGFKLSFDGGTTYHILASDVSGTATPYNPSFLVSQVLVLSSAIAALIASARKVKITLYASDGTTPASQTATTLGLIYGSPATS